MTQEEFEKLLDAVAQRLTKEAVASPFAASKLFENRVREVLKELGGLDVDLAPDAQAFPDIVVGDFGVEVKFTEKDTWRSVANSIFESKREQQVKYVYLIFGKMGGDAPEVRWGKYENCVMHVRTSHMPRFEVEITTDKPLFARMGTTYDDFRRSSLDEKMLRIREYARGRLKKGEHLWWLEDRPDSDHAVELNIRFYKNLEEPEQRKLRAEAALLCPQIVGDGKGGAGKHKYDDAIMYLIARHGVVIARDSFSAGSVTGKITDKGGNYVMKGLRLIEQEILAAADYLDDALFVEYWGESCPVDKRISEWLRRADKHAKGWKPSEELFRRKGKNG